MSTSAPLMTHDAAQAATFDPALLTAADGVETPDTDDEFADDENDGNGVGIQFGPSFDFGKPRAQRRRRNAMARTRRSETVEVNHRKHAKLKRDGTPSWDRPSYLK